MTAPLIIALDGRRTITRPTADQFATWAYEAHTEACATCRRGDTWCETGRRLLAATAPANDLPGYDPI
jgi:hypothetical protein